MNALGRTKYSFSPERAAELLVDVLRAGKAMKQFWCFFINEDDSVGSFEPLEVKRDEEAIQKAEAMLRSRYAASAAELWADGHFVVRVQRPSNRS